jgi:hypothetical protein
MKEGSEGGTVWYKCGKHMKVQEEHHFCQDVLREAVYTVWQICLERKNLTVKGPTLTTANWSLQKLLILLAESF